MLTGTRAVSLHYIGLEVGKDIKENDILYISKTKQYSNRAQGIGRRERDQLAKVVISLSGFTGFNLKLEKTQSKGISLHLYFLSQAV